MKARATVYLLIAVMSFVQVACGDTSDGDSSGRTGNGAIEATVGNYNATAEDTMQTLCDCYAGQTHGGDVDACMQEYHQPIALSSCEQDAARCDADSFTAVYECYRDAAVEYQECVAQCPTRSGFGSCNDALNAAEAACNGHVSAELSAAMGQCEAGQPVTCGSSGGGGSSQSDEECRQQFRQVVAGDRHWGEYFSGTVDSIQGGRPVDDCSCGEPCATVLIKFYPDGTFWRHWLQSDEHCDINSGMGGVHAEGTWEVIGCGVVRLSECSGDVIDVPWELEGESLKMQLPWRIGGNTFSLNFELEQNKGGCCVSGLTSSHCE